MLVKSRRELNETHSTEARYRTHGIHKGTHDDA